MTKEVMIQGTSGPFETFVAQWLRMKGYLVQTPVNYRREGGEIVKGRFWSDIDIVGTRGNEVVIVECQESLTQSQEDTKNKLERKFKDAMGFLASLGVTEGKNVILYFAMVHENKGFEKELMTLGRKLGKSITHITFDNITNEMIQFISLYISPTHIGRFTEPVTWFLSRLIYNDWIGKLVNCPQCSSEVYDDNYCPSCGKKLH